MTSTQTSWKARLEWLLFLTLWLGYGTLINSGNLVNFGLQQAGVEAYVERHHFYLEGSTVPALHVQPVIDAFLHDGHIYPAKQPGQFMLGSLVYSFLHSVGLTYATNYLLTAALVTFLSASVVTAVSAVAVFRTACVVASDRSGLFWPLMVALAYGLGSTLLAYSGIAWHDTIATGFLAIALYLIVRIGRMRDEKRRLILAGCTGIFLGLTVTTSMLAFFPAAVAAIFVVCERRWKLLVALLLGGIIGLAPLLIYNTVCFGNPFQMPNVVGGYRDTFWHFDWQNFRGKIGFYSRMVSLYMPIGWLGLIGIGLYPGSRRREKVLLAGMVLSLSAYILNIDATGTCQYGPRYLLPVIPAMTLGLMGFTFLTGAAIRRVASITVALCCLLSLFINLLGAVHGAMLCDFPHWAVGRYLSEMRHGPIVSYPLATLLLVPLCACLVLLIYSIVRPRQPTG
jgi:hypothetical protein